MVKNWIWEEKLCGLSVHLFYTGLIPFTLMRWKIRSCSPVILLAVIMLMNGYLMTLSAVIFMMRTNIILI